MAEVHFVVTLSKTLLPQCLFSMTEGGWRGGDGGVGGGVCGGSKFESENTESLFAIDQKYFSSSNF